MNTEKKWSQAATLTLDADTGALLTRDVGGGGGGGNVGLLNIWGVQVNPAREETLREGLFSPWTGVPVLPVVNDNIMYGLYDSLSLNPYLQQIQFLLQSAQNPITGAFRVEVT